MNKRRKTAFGQYLVDQIKASGMSQEAFHKKVGVAKPTFYDWLHSAPPPPETQYRILSVFEEHLPESTRLYGVPIRKGSMVTLKIDKSGQTFVVLRKIGDTAVCLPRDGGETVMHPLSDLVMVAEFGVAIKGDVITKQPKSKSSKRTLTIGKSACRVLKTAKKEYDKERSSYGPGFCKEEYVIHLKDGSPYHPDSLTQKWGRFMAKHNLKHIRLHDLRHSCATSMVANNVDTKTVQKRMGHSSYKTTMDLYVHRTQSMDDKAAEIMDQVIVV